MNFTRKKKSNYYYDSFPRLAHYAVECSHMILELFNNFDPSKVESVKEKVHQIEHQGDEAKHEVTEKLTLEFMTPIDREDILSLLHLIDDVTDAVEDISLNVYLCDFKKLPHGVNEFMALIDNCVAKTEECLSHFPEFAKKDAIKPYLTAVLSLEEEADALYEKHVRTLYQNEDDALLLHKSEKLYDLLEAVTDACREVAKAVETIIFKNL